MRWRWIFIWAARGRSSKPDHAARAGVQENQRVRHGVLPQPSHSADRPHHHALARRSQSCTPVVWGYLAPSRPDCTSMKRWIRGPRSQQRYAAPGCNDETAANGGKGPGKEQLNGVLRLRVDAGAWLPPDLSPPLPPTPSPRGVGHYSCSIHLIRPSMGDSALTLMAAQAVSGQPTFDPERQGCNLYVKHLADMCTDDKLRTMFSVCPASGLLCRVADLHIYRYCAEAVKCCPGQFRPGVQTDFVDSESFDLQSGSLYTCAT